jgi:hypothetical protein
MRQPRYSADETVRRGQEIYERSIRPQVENAHPGKYVLIDVETGDFEVGDDYDRVAQRMLARKPDAALCALRIGHSAVGRIGWGLTTG